MGTFRLAKRNVSGKGDGESMRGQENGETGENDIAVGEASVYGAAESFDRGCKGGYSRIDHEGARAGRYGREAIRERDMVMRATEKA